MTLNFSQDIKVRFLSTLHYCHKYPYFLNATTIGFYVMPKSGEKKNELLWYGGKSLTLFQWKGKKRVASCCLEEQMREQWFRACETSSSLKAPWQSLWSWGLQPAQSGSMWQNHCTQQCQLRPQWNWPDLEQACPKARTSFPSLPVQEASLTTVHFKWGLWPDKISLKFLEILTLLAEDIEKVLFPLYLKCLPREFSVPSEIFLKSKNIS